MSTAPDPVSHERKASRSVAAVGPFVIGVPLAVAFLLFVRFGPLSETPLERYLHHPVEMVEVVLFACATAALALKMWATARERAALGLQVLPPWDGQPAPVSDAPGLRASLYEAAGKRRGSLLVRRIDAVLDFVRCRGSAEGLDDQLRALADTDGLAQENSFALIRFITWAIPILGFLGTVLGITTAIADVTPEALEKSMSNVTQGLAVAFDATAVALALTMVTMFLSFLTERGEQNVLEEVDRFTEIQLAHRFERGAPDQSQIASALHRNTQVLLQATEHLVKQQAAIWANALAAAQQQWSNAAAKQEQALGRALEQALEKTLQGHRTAAAGTIEALSAQTAALARLQEEGKQLARLQDLLNQNLNALQGAGAFEQAVQTLTAAIHLLTTKATSPVSGPSASRLGTRPGAAA
jgi:hypothetical protein